MVLFKESPQEAKEPQWPIFLPEQMSTQLPVPSCLSHGLWVCTVSCLLLRCVFLFGRGASWVPVGEGGALPGPGIEKSWQDPQDALASQLSMGSPGESVSVSLEQGTAKRTCL